jgi:hypothetical protein
MVYSLWFMVHALWFTAYGFMVYSCTVYSFQPMNIWFYRSMVYSLMLYVIVDGMIVVFGAWFG